MRPLFILILLILSSSCGRVPPTTQIPSPTPSPPKPAASTTPTPGQPTPTRTPAPPIVFEFSGVKFQIEDAAIYSNCLTLVFAVRGFHLPSGLSPDALFPPARNIDVRVVTPDDALLAEPLGDGGGQHGTEQNGKIWLQQFALYSLPREIPEGQEVALEVTVTLDEDFQSGQPLFYLVPVISGPSPGSCP